MTFDEWWDANDMDSDPDANYTVSEIVWKNARKDLVEQQFQRRKKTTKEKRRE